MFLKIETFKLLQKVLSRHPALKSLLPKHEFVNNPEKEKLNLR